MTARLRITAAVAVLASAVAAAAGPTAGAAGLELDPTFAGTGTTALGVRAGGVSGVAAFAGRVYLASDRGAITAVGTDGENVGSYGVDGTARLAGLGDLALVPSPRSGDPAGLFAAGARAEFVVDVTRLDGRGHLDPKWGTGGHALLFTDLTAPSLTFAAITVDPSRPGGLFAAAFRYGTYDPRTNHFGDSTLYITRLDPSGTVDQTYGVSGIATIVVPVVDAGLVTPSAGLTAAADGSLNVSIVERGTDFIAGTHPTRFGSAQITPTGAPVTGLGGRVLTGRGAVSGVVTSAADGRGGILVADTYSRSPRLRRFGPDGTLDAAYGSVKLPPTSYLAMQSAAGRILLLGNSARTGAGARVVQLTTRGSHAGNIAFGITDQPVNAQLRRLTTDEYGRAIVAGTVGGIDFAREETDNPFLAVARLRTVPPDLDLQSGAAIRVRPDGGVDLTLACARGVPGGCRRTRLVVRQDATVLARAVVAPTPAGHTRTLHLRTGRTGRALAAARVKADVWLTPAVVRPERGQQTIPVVRVRRLAPGRAPLRRASR